MGDRRASYHWEQELLGAPDILLLSSLNICTNRLGGPLDRFGGHLQACQEPELFAALSERRLASDGCQQAPYAGREIRFVDIQLNISGKLSMVALGTQVVGAVDARATHRRENRSGTHLLISGRVTTGTRNCAMRRIWWMKAQ